MLDAHGIRPSTNRPRCVQDNAHMESFFHSMKAELIKGCTFEDIEILRRALKGYLNQFYNRWRLHSSLGYRSPQEMEREAA